MNRDYHFLIGLQFAADGAVYVVRNLAAADGQTTVEALSDDEAANPRVFSLRDVINWLLVEEEIELFNPNYLSAR